jgi:23S rRNA pseudouridine2605 synthase
MQERLQKILSQAGVGSRRFCETLISGGKVCVNGEVVTELGTKADYSVDKITVDGKSIEISKEKIYILLNKPEGYTTTRSDPHAQKTVMELLPFKDEYLYPIGRLDVDTSGLLILTNDGEFTQLLSHPKHKIDKTYVAKVKGKISPSDMRKLENGIVLEEGLTAPAQVSLVRYLAAPNVSIIKLVIHEGRKRQVRRMFANIFHDVIQLSRVSIGGLSLDDMKPGQFRYLDKDEVRLLKALASGKQKNRPPIRGK